MFTSFLLNSNNIVFNSFLDLPFDSSTFFFLSSNNSFCSFSILFFFDYTVIYNLRQFSGSIFKNPFLFLLTEEINLYKNYKP